MRLFSNSWFKHEGGIVGVSGVKDFNPTDQAFDFFSHIPVQALREKTAPAQCTAILNTSPRSGDHWYHSKPLGRLIMPRMSP